MFQDTTNSLFVKKNMYRVTHFGQSLKPLNTFFDTLLLNNSDPPPPPPKKKKKKKNWQLQILTNFI